MGRGQRKRLNAKAMNTKQRRNAQWSKIQAVAAQRWINQRGLPGSATSLRYLRDI